MALKQNAQAVTELAIIGALVIAAFSFLINYSEKLNRQQANIQQTFRAALKEAGNANNQASYIKRVFLRMPNVANPMELGQLDSFNDSADVLWTDGKDRDSVYLYTYNDFIKQGQWRVVARNPQPGVAKYQLNEEVISVPMKPNKYDNNGNPLFNPPPSPKNIPETFTNIVDATTSLTQTGSGSIATTKTLTAYDTLTSTVSINDIDGNPQPRTFTHHLGQGGKYSSGGSGIIR